MTQADQPQQIEAAQVSLSHQEQPRRARQLGNRWLPMLLTTLGGFALVVGLLWLTPKLLTDNQASSATETPSANNSGTAGRTAPQTGAGAAATSNKDKLPPFAASQREVARERAQAKLKAFVEKQLALEEDMSVAGWGAERFNDALNLATGGDAKFVAEDFVGSIADYSAATEQLDEVIAEGLAKRQAALVAGEQALQSRNPADALSAFATALLISPSHAEALKGQTRATRLPKIIDLEREAKNHELGGRWEDAAALYREIRTLDPDLNGIAEHLASVSRGQQDQSVKQYLSEAFAALEARRYSSAKNAFNQVLALDPNNSVAKGGLQQVSQETEVSQIGQLESRAATAVQGEDWTTAIKHYTAALAMDANAAFAKRGMDEAKAQQAAHQILDQIIAEPDKLSSEKLLKDGRKLLVKARELKRQGPKLTAKVSSVELLLQEYATPVSVELRSDERTQVLLSTVGKLGAFARKTVQLRPGAYTLIGSRDGCRDVRQELLVRPNMQPIQIVCQDEL